MRVHERTDLEIDDLYKAVSNRIDEGGGSRYPGMTYEEGIEAVLGWLLNNEDHPYEERME